MAKMKKGAQTGKCDAHFDGIRVGDRLRNPEGEVARVDEYGSLLIVGGEKLGPKEWEGGAWNIISDVEEEIFVDETKPVEDLPAFPSGTISTEEPEEAPQTMEQPITDEDLILELKRRGYSGVLQHTYSVTREVKI
jgi:hypothetical protein